MKAGLLRHRIKIEVGAETQNSFNEEVLDWSTFATRSASVSPLKGRELFDAQQRYSEVTHKIVMRYLAGVLPKMRVSFDSRFFDINAVLNIDERGIELHLLCSEIV